MARYTDDPFAGLFNYGMTTADEGLFNDGQTSGFTQDSATDYETEWYDDVALSLDPERGSAYEYTMSLMKDINGVDENDGMQDYTYFGLPAEGAAPNILEDFE